LQSNPQPDTGSNLFVRKERHLTTNRRERTKRRDRNQSKTSSLPQTVSVPDLPPELDPKSPLSIAMAKIGISRTQISLTDIFTKINASWSKPVDQTPLAGDFPRLASRVVIQDYRSGKNEEYIPCENETPKELVAKIMNRVCEIVENDKTICEKFCAYIESVKDSSVDLVHWTEDLLEFVGVESKTVAVCKTINQNIIMPVATQIKVIILSLTNGFTKDVRTADGWRIIIRFSDDEVICTHIKKEVSMATGPNSFEFEWHLNITLNSEVDKVEKIQLTLTGLNCNEEMPKEQKQRLTEALAQVVEE